MPQFETIGRLSLERFCFTNNKPETIERKFKENRAVYHKSCVDAYNQQKLERAKKRARESQENDSTTSNEQGKKRPTRSAASFVNKGEPKCIFCLKYDTLDNLTPAGTLHAKTTEVDHKHNAELTERLHEKALYLGDSQLLSILSVGTVAVNELNYHHLCLVAFNNRYNYTKATNDKAKLDGAIEFRKEVNFQKVVAHIKEQRQLGEISFRVNHLESMYINLLDRDGIEHNQSHVGRFGERLQNAFSRTKVEIRTVNNKNTMLFSNDLDDIMSDLSPASFVEASMKIIAPLRAEMSKVRNNFNFSFSPESQEKNSVPILLQVLCSLLIDGCDLQSVGFSKVSVSIAEMVMYQYRKNVPSSTTSLSSTVRRHCKERETSTPVYVGLKLYACVRAKSLVQKLFLLGISISYDRCLEICDSIGSNLLYKYDRDGVFIAGNLRFDLFTIVAKDNIDLNGRSTKIKDHFHGISLTQLQFPSTTDIGIKQEALYDLGADKPIRKLKLPDDYVAFKDVPCGTKSSLFMPVCTTNIDYHQFTNTEFDKGRNAEISWLESAEKTQCIPWSSFHSTTTSSIDQTPGINALMPLINKKVSTLEAQYHIMSMVKKIVQYVNHNQVPIDVSDQPVFALSKELQLRLPQMFGYDKYICMLGDLHIEQSLLVMHGQLIKGSGLDSIMSNTNLSTAGGTTALVDVNHIKRSRYCLQVSVIVVYKLLKAAHLESQSSLTLFEWLDQMCKTSEMCLYWKLILEFQIQVLVFVRAIREGNFPLYLETLFRFLKWYFALDKFNYARWATIYWFDLALLEKRCPSEFKEFVDGKFSFLKTNKKFSRMALDQVHEQNNKYIKSVSGATSLINRQDDAALIRWELCGAELCRILQEFEVKKDEVEDEKSKHHEDTKKFKDDFSRDISVLLEGFPHNPFKLSTLTVVNNPETVFDDHIYYNISQLEVKGAEQLHTFISERLVKSKISIDSKIKLNDFALPGSEKSKKPRGSIVDKRLTIPFLTKLRAAITYRRQHARLLFQTEIYDVSQSLSVNMTDMYHGTKSSILQRIEPTEYIATDRSSSAMIIELSPFFRKDIVAENFDGYAAKLHEELRNVSSGYGRVDIITDRYIAGSLKTLTREGRGNGPVVMFNGKSSLPTKFRDSFLKNSDNKNRLNSFLADKILSLHRDDRTLIITKDTSILSNNFAITSDEILTPNRAEEADQKIVRHMIQCVKSGIHHVVIRTVDTDVIISLLAYRHHAQNIDSTVLALLRAGGKSVYYDATEITLKLGEKVFQGLPFFHALTGCDLTSIFMHDASALALS